MKTFRERLEETRAAAVSRSEEGRCTGGDNGNKNGSLSLALMVQPAAAAAASAFAGGGNCHAREISGGDDAAMKTATNQQQKERQKKKKSVYKQIIREPAENDDETVSVASSKPRKRSSSSMAGRPKNKQKKQTTFRLFDDDTESEDETAMAAAASGAAPAAAAAAPPRYVPAVAAGGAPGASRRDGSSSGAAEVRQDRHHEDKRRLRTEDGDSVHDDAEPLQFNLTRDSMREELCKMTGKKYTPAEGRSAIRILYKYLTNDNNEVKTGDSLKRFHQLFLDLGGVDSVLTFIKTRHHKDDLVYLQQAAAILVACCSDCNPDEEKPSNGDDEASRLCEQIVKFGGVKTLIEIISRFEGRSTEREVVDAFDQIWHVLSNICAVDKCLILMEKESHLNIIQVAMSCMQAIVETRSNGGDDDPIRDRTNAVDERRVLLMANSCLIAVDNLCDNENGDSKINYDDYRRLNMLKNILGTASDAINLTVVRDKKWDDDLLEVISNVLTIVATFNMNKWLKIEDFDLMSPFLDDLLRTLSPEAYEGFGEFLFTLITVMTEHVPKAKMQESVVAVALQRLISTIVDVNFATPANAKKEARVILKQIWK